jgi:hypothetical protein
MSGASRCPGKCRKTPRSALAWQSVLQVRTFGMAEVVTGSGGGGGDVVSMAFY